MRASAVEAETDLVAQAHHLVANNLALLVALVRMQARALAKSPEPLSGAEARRLLDGVAVRIAVVSQLHRLLARTPEDDALVDLGDHLTEVCRALSEIVATAEQSVHLALSARNCRIKARQVQPLTLILCEIVINALKHAHPESGPLRVTISCEQDAQGTFVMEMRDDGVGLPAGFDTTRDGGLGFRVIRSLGAKLGADLQITSGPGVCFRLRMPPAKPV